MRILLKVYNAYRPVVAVCDKGLYGKKFSEGEKILDLTGGFFGGEEVSLEDLRKELLRYAREDATFNFVGEGAVSVAKDLGIIKEEGILKIENIPFALVLL